MEWLRVLRAVSLFCILICLPIGSCDKKADAPPDDAKAAELTAADFPQISADLFHQMDGGLDLAPDEIRGRNDWLLWTAGNQVFWDRVAGTGYGIVDLIKTLDSRRRSHRFAEMGLINEPGFRTASHSDVYGLWLDEPTAPPSVDIDQRVYGRSSGVIGFRIYPNPNFSVEAQRRWDPERYYNDPSYYEDPSLVRPYRIGVACAVCHVSFSPLSPPADPENPAWRNLSSAIGNQYLREGAAFTLVRPGSFLWEILNAQPPGTSDTSRPANDHINNPSAINAIFELGARIAEGTPEQLAGGALAWPGDAVRSVPHFLKDGADSVGPAGAMLRVYVNEGLYSQLSLRDHDLLLGLTPQRPFDVATAFENSVYWQATYSRTTDIAKFFLRLQPMHLEDAPGGSDYLTSDTAKLERGKIVFADNCATCHSSKQPPAEIAPGSPEAQAWYRRSVASADFREGNFLSNDRRYPVTLIKTNACRTLGTNATRGAIWDNFSSETYKSLPSVGTIEVYNPALESMPYRFEMPSGGVGYYRPASLIALWSSAPFLHNNSLGVFTGDPSVAGRMRAFNDAIEKLLWPEQRLSKASILRTSQESWLRFAQASVPVPLRALAKDGFVSIGPIPKGTPINLIANLDPSVSEAIKLIATLNTALAEMAESEWDLSRLTDSETAKQLVATLMAASKCPDLVEDRGHEFGARLPDTDKRALIEFLKTL